MQYLFDYWHDYCRTNCQYLIYQDVDFLFYFCGTRVTHSSSQSEVMEEWQFPPNFLGVLVAKLKKLGRCKATMNVLCHDGAYVQRENT